nr:MAG TPA: hypothetical protein [Caudoviricetes sp.]
MAIGCEMVARSGSMCLIVANLVGETLEGQCGGGNGDWVRDGCAEWVDVSHENILAQKAYGVNPYP